MILEQQVCSLELAKRLKGLGVKQESAFYWTEYLNGNEVDFRIDQQLVPPSSCSAFTVAELGEMLPMTVHGEFDQLISEKAIEHWFVYYSRSREPAGHAARSNVYLKTADTEADARAAVLIYLIENKLVTILSVAK